MKTGQTWPLACVWGIHASYSKLDLGPQLEQDPADFCKYSPIWCVSVWSDAEPRQCTFHRRRRTPFLNRSPRISRCFWQYIKSVGTQPRCCMSWDFYDHHKQNINSRAVGVLEKMTQSEKMQTENMQLQQSHTIGYQIKAVWKLWGECSLNNTTNKRASGNSVLMFSRGANVNGNHRVWYANSKPWWWRILNI